jgi:hypothetical protein
LFLGDGIQQPQQQKKRHHGSHEVGIGNLPGAAMRSVAAFNDLFYDYCLF